MSPLPRPCACTPRCGRSAEPLSRAGPRLSCNPQVWQGFTESFSPGRPSDWRGSAWWCGRDWAGGVRAGPPGIVCSDQLNPLPGGVPARVSYPAALDVPESIAHAICLWLAAHRRAHDARPWQRAAACRVQAVLLLRWVVAGTALTALARDSRVSRAMAYWYPLRGPGGDRRPGPGTARGPSVTARIRRAVRVSGRDPDPHRPGVSAHPRNRPSSVVFGQGRGVRGQRAGGGRTPLRHRMSRPATTRCPPCGPPPRGRVPCSSTSRPCNESAPGPAAITTIMAAALVIITLWHESW